LRNWGVASRVPREGKWKVRNKRKKKKIRRQRGHGEVKALKPGKNKEGGTHRKKNERYWKKGLKRAEEVWGSA